MKDMIRVGLRWFNPLHVMLIEVTPDDNAPAVKVHVANPQSGGKVVWDFVGDEAEAFLKEVGYDKVSRAAKKAAEAKAAQETAEIAAKAAKDTEAVLAKHEAAQKAEEAKHAVAPASAPAPVTEEKFPHKNR